MLLSTAVLSVAWSAPPLPMGDDGAPPCLKGDCATATWLQIPGPNPLLIDGYGVDDMEMVRRSSTLSHFALRLPPWFTLQRLTPSLSPLSLFVCRLAACSRKMGHSR